METLQGQIRGIKYISLYEPSGYGIAAKRYLIGLINSGIPITWTPMVPGNALGRGFDYEPYMERAIGEPELDAICNKSIEYDTVIIHLVPEYFPLWIKREPNKKLIGYTVWETDKLPHHWPPLLNMVDQLLVPCHWNKDVFEKCGVTTPIDVIPHISVGPSHKVSNLSIDISPSDFVFYTIGTWTTRKAVFNTLKCYLNTFTAHDPTVLVIKTSVQDFSRSFFRYFTGHTKGVVKKIKNSYNSPARFVIITEELSDNDILRLHHRGDCYISLCRSEGWGLGAFDAAGLGKPVIITGFGGQLDYLPGEFSFLVNYKMIPVQDKIGKKSYSADQNWAEPDINHASSLMKQVFVNREEASSRGQRLQEFIRNNFNETYITKKMLQIITVN